MNRVNKWLMKRAMMQLGFESAKILCIIGGLVVLVSGLYYFVLSRMAVGLVAAVISGQVKHLMWSAIMVVVGVVAYVLSGGGSIWSWGAILVIVGGVLGALVHVL
jgi:hypothetical protein